MNKEEIKKELIKELEKWSKKYSFNFQFWPTQKTVYIEKDDVELKIIPDCETVEECIIEAINYIRKINRLQTIEEPEEKKMTESESEEIKTALENGLYSTGNFLPEDCEKISEGLLIYLKDII